MTPNSIRQIVSTYLHGVLVNFLEAIRRWKQDDAGILAACVAYYTTLSLFPLIMVLIAGLGIFLRFSSLGQDSEQFVLTVIAQETTHEVAAQVNTAFQQVERQALLGGPLAMIGLIAAAMAVITQFDMAFDKIWKVDPPRFEGYVSAARRAIGQRIRAFIVLFSLGGVVGLIFFASLAMNAVARIGSDQLHVLDPFWENLFWRITEVTVSLSLNTLVFTAIYKGLSKVSVGWLHAARGGLLAAATWEVGRLLLATYFTVANYSAYGVIGALLAAMLWIYYASSVLFLGAEYVQVIREHSQRADRESDWQRELNEQILTNEAVQEKRAPVAVRRVKPVVRRAA